MDVLYDYKRVNGWKLLYSTFKYSGSPLVDPYFVLYNVYRGTLRIYFYINSITNTFSSYIQDAVYLNGLTASHILNYLGTDIVDTESNTCVYNSMRPQPLSGGAPLANNQWYMVEYELAYDPNLANIGYNQLRFQVKSDYYQIDTIRLGGEIKTAISGSIGAKSTSAMDLVQSEFQEAKKGVAGVLGVGMLNALGVQSPPSNGSNNKVGIKNTVFSSLVSAVTGMASSFFSGLPSFAVSLLNAIIGGSSSSAGTTVSLKAENDIRLRGAITSSGAIGNWSMYIPGTHFFGTISGYIPLYNELLGVVYFSGDNTLYMQQQSGTGVVEMEIGEGTLYFQEQFTHRDIAFDLQGGNYEQNLIFNPAVEALANISVISEDLILKEPNSGGLLMNEIELEGYELEGPYGYSDPIPDYEYGVRFLIEVQPKDGSPASYLYKTFKLTPYLVGCQGIMSNGELMDRLEQYKRRNNEVER